MWKAALVMVVVGVGVGAMMPAAPPSDNEAVPERPAYVVQEASTPSAAPVSTASGGTLALPRHDDGHFYANADINGTSTEFMVDTGATVISLTRADAERAGLTIDPAHDTVVAQGASGPVMGQVVNLRELSLGDHRLTDVPALVLASSGQSLLGQNVLSQFESVSIEHDEMLLR